MTETLVQTMNEIEQYRFSSELNLASGTKAFRRGLRRHRLFEQLADEAKDPAVRSAIAKRVAELAAEPVDARYENKYDAALSTYLMVLSDTAEPETIVKSASVVARAVNLWWAAGISQELIAHGLATGCAESTAAQTVISTPKPYASDAQNVISVGLHKLGWTELRDSATTTAGNQIIEALRGAGVRAQAKVSTVNDVIAMPLPSADGRQATGKHRGRNRIQSRSRRGSNMPHGGRQVVRG